jgi:fibronectin-binding autotransporter adhesin
MKKSAPLRPALVAALLSAFAVNTQAATLTWDGGGDGSTWTDASNWDTNTAPNTTGTPAYDAIVFGAADPGTVNVGSGQSALSLTFDNASTFTMDLGANNFTQRGNITVTSGSHIITGSGSGRVAVNPATFTIYSADGTGLSIRGLDYNGKNIVLTNSTGSGTANVTFVIGSQTYTSNNFAVNTGINLDLQAGVGSASTSAAAIFSGGGNITNSTGTTRQLTVGGTTSNGTFSGNISGNLNFQKGRSNSNDTGIQTLSGTNSYAGTTTVFSGTLLVNGTHTSGGAYAIRGRTTAGADGILGGNGSINVGANNIVIGDTTASSAVGRLQPGSAALTIGTLTTTAASLNFTAESIFTVDLNTTSGNSIDLVNHTGNVSITSGATLSLNQLFGFDAATFFNGASYTFLNYSGSVTGSFLLDSGSASLLNANNYALLNDTANTQLQLVSTAIPEPSSYAVLAGVATLGLVALRRRRSVR